MSLNWELSKVENYDEVCFYAATEDDPNHGVKKGDRLLNPVTNALIWASISVELGGITRANAEEWYARLRVVQKLFGTLLTRDGQDREITAEEVRAHIGLSVNVSPVSEMKWRTKQINLALGDGVRIYQSAMKKIGVPA